MVFLGVLYLEVLGELFECESCLRFLREKRKELLLMVNDGNLPMGK